MARLEGEGIYRRVAIRMHSDEKVRKLSRPKPCGKSLWWELIAGEQTGIIPGLFRIGELSFADQLGWSLRGFRAAWKEVAEQDMVRADWEARLVWVPNGVRHNLPASPNVVLSWRDAWDLLPECDLKEQAANHILKLLMDYSKPYGEAFEKVCGKSLAKASAKASPNQEQQQEQEQEQEQEEKQQRAGEASDPKASPKAGGAEKDPEGSLPYPRDLFDRLQAALTPSAGAYAKHLRVVLAEPLEKRIAAAEELLRRGAVDADGNRAGWGFLAAMVRNGVGGQPRVQARGNGAPRPGAVKHEHKAGPVDLMEFLEPSGGEP